MPTRKSTPTLTFAELESIEQKLVVLLLALGKLRTMSKEDRVDPEYFAACESAVTDVLDELAERKYGAQESLQASQPTRAA